MKKVTEKEFYIGLLDYFGIDKVEVLDRKKIYIDSYKKFTQDIYDLSKEAVEPLSKKETLIVRKRYGIFNNGIMMSQTAIERELGIKSSALHRALTEIEIKVKYLSIEKATFVDSEAIDKRTLVSISDLNFSLRTFCCLKAAGINIVNDFKYLSTSDLDKVRNLDLRYKQEIIDTVHKFGVKFKDEVDRVDVEEERIRIEREINASLSFSSPLKKEVSDKVKVKCKTKK